MITFRRHHEPTPPPAWIQAPVCAEYHASGLELQLIDLIEARERAIYGGFDGVEDLDAEIAAIHDELARLDAQPWSATSPAA